MGCAEAGERVGEGLSLRQPQALSVMTRSMRYPKVARVWAARKMKLAQVSLLWLSWISE